tara:strand:+ start:305 stop:502 length:198 start_codon:yes stop_codon:yes gene_type:complete
MRTEFLDGQGYAGFHSLRVTYITLVVEAGSNVKEAQTLARHSPPNLTMNIYSARAWNELAFRQWT